MITSTLGAESDKKEVFYPELSKHVSGLAPSDEIVTKYLHPAAYLETLKVEDPTVILDGPARYQLARNLLDVHYLCMALSHQGYNFEPKEFPILQLASSNFEGFEKCRGEGGYWSHLWTDFFNSSKIDWSPSSNFEKQAK